MAHTVVRRTRIFLTMGLIAGFIVLGMSARAVAQGGARTPGPMPNTGSTLFGNFKVDGGTGVAKMPETFHLILYFTTGLVYQRTTVSNPGQYRFLNVVNGVYDLVIEVDNQEMVRERLNIQEISKTDIRRDLNLTWSGSTAAATAATVATYNRSAANQAKYDTALAVAKDKKNDEAAELLKQVVGEDPKDYVAWAELGTVQFKQEKLGDAEKSYRKALEAKPDYIVALMNLGKLQIAQKNFEAAIETLTKAVAAQPQSADANHYLGESYLQVKKGSKAVGYLNEAIKLDPMGKAELHLRLATLYNAAGLKDRAAAEYEVFISKKPDHADKKKFEEYIKANKKM